MKYYIIAGEASGDLHGSNLIKELRKADPGTEVRCWGGDLMAAAGGTLVKHYRDLAFMGFVEVLSNLRTIFRNLDFCKEDITSYKPDALILIDYPGFNMRIAKWAHAQGIRIIYYISPQVWAWKEGRVKQIKEYVDKMLVILPFEKAFYGKWNYEVEYVGHPLVEVIDSFLAGQPAAPTLHSSQPATTSSHTSQPANINPYPGQPAVPTLHTSQPAVPTISSHPDAATPQARSASANLQVSSASAEGVPRPLIALLPGSRKQEILKKLPVMLEVARYFPDYEFVVAQAPGQEDAFYETILKGYPNVSSVKNQTYALLAKAKAACVTSGTATLETALFAVPEIVCYKGSAISYQIAKRLIKVKYISLVNLIMDKLVVKELIQDQLTTENLREELEIILKDPRRQQQLNADYKALHNLLSQGGHASANAARSIIDFLRAGR